MHLLYVDESGDPSTSANSPSPYFFLAGLLVASSHWPRLIRELHDFRAHLLAKYGLPLSEEIHASYFLNNRTALAQTISSNNRLRILQECLDWCATRPYVQLLTVGKNKSASLQDSVFLEVWTALYQLLDEVLAEKNTLLHPATGAVLCDNTDGGRLTKLVRQLQRPASGPGLRHVIEDPIFRDSRASYLHQLVDVVAYFAKQLFEPSNFVQQKGAGHYFTRLATINLLVPTPRQPWGIRLL